MAKLAVVCLVAFTALVAKAPDTRADGSCPASWRLVGTDTFRLHNTLMRSQGVTATPNGWIFSWQGGLSRTLPNYAPIGIGAITPQFVPSARLNGENHVTETHIGDVDLYGNVLYVPEEDGEQGEGPISINTPEYQHPYIALYNARTLTFTGTSYPLDVDITEAGVPWVAIDSDRHEVYTGEWPMHHDRLNVYDLQMRFKRFLSLHYPGSLGPDFHLSRVQGMEVRGHTLYAARDDADKSVFAIDTRSGVVTKLFSLNPPPGHDELEGISVHRTADGALLHVLLVVDNDLPNDVAKIHVDFRHYAPVGSAPC